jgi:hypothetical protein
MIVWQSCWSLTQHVYQTEMCFVCVVLHPPCCPHCSTTWTRKSLCLLPSFTLSRSPHRWLCTQLVLLEGTVLMIVIKYGRNINRIPLKDVGRGSVLGCVCHACMHVATCPGSGLCWVHVPCLHVLGVHDAAPYVPICS